MQVVFLSLSFLLTGGIFLIIARDPGTPWWVKVFIGGMVLGSGVLLYNRLKNR